MNTALLSIIIPTLNEADYLPRCLEYLRLHSQEPQATEIVVVDCNSKDRTAIIAKEAGCKLISFKPKKHNKSAALNLGAKHARGQILFFLDADSLAPLDFDSAIRSSLMESKVVGGAFHFCLEERGSLLRLIELINRIRYTIWKQYYGDQGIFVSRKAFEKIGGYPSRDILEAVEFCNLLKRLGRLKLISKCMTTSARRFIEGGVLRVFLKDVCIWFCDLTGWDTQRFAADYWSYNEDRIHLSFLKKTKKTQKP